MIPIQPHQNENSIPGFNLMPSEACDHISDQLNSLSINEESQSDLEQKSYNGPNESKLCEGGNISDDQINFTDEDFDLEDEAQQLSHENFDCQNNIHVPMTDSRIDPDVNFSNDTISSQQNSVDSKKTSQISDPDPRIHLNIVFIGHVDAGKSTTCGNILYLTGQVDDRTIEKYEKEAKEKSRESWFLAFVMDTNEEERARGKTFEVGRAHFETESRRFTILDAPGHKSLVPNMISGAAQADIAVLIVSARKGEFETGFEKRGQTREHVLLTKTLGVNTLIVAVNKMNDTTCNWDKNRYDEIVLKLSPFLKKSGYSTKDVHFLPVSALTGQNLLHHVSDKNFPKTYDEKASWYTLDQPTLFQIFDSLTPVDRDHNGFLRIPIVDGYKDGGITVLGKVEFGTVYHGEKYILMPNKYQVRVTGIFLEDIEVSYARPGEDVRLKLVGIDEDQITRGSVLCSCDSLCPVVIEFEAQIGIVELLEHRPVISAGYSCVIHIHTAMSEVQFAKLIEVTDKKTRKKKLNPRFVKDDCILVCLMQLATPMCMEQFNIVSTLGRFTLRDEGKTIAVGKVLKIVSTV